MFFLLKDKDKKEINQLSGREFSCLGLKETDDIEEWAIKTPELLGEELLIIESQYQEFKELNKRLDILAFDKNGKLVVVELKRDKADKNSDLQVIKYASYVANITSKDIQKSYKKFWNKRGKNLTSEDVAQKFKSFLEDSEKELSSDGEGWVNFDLDNKPRIFIVAGSFGKEITAPVM